ncbi:hypothetical protein [Chitinophaga sp. 22620]|uniref:hypothetical protein n=1 Tax=Chitinophaga sp. 22620 TaxID=3453952 RepID=UPI003F87F551
MAKYKIPQTYIPGFTFLANLDIAEVEQIKNALIELPVGTGPTNFRNALAGKFSNIEGINYIATVIFSFGSFLNENDDDFNKDEIAEDLVEAFKVINTKNEISKENIESLAPKIKLLLTNCDNLKLSFKALSLQSENAIIYRSSRVISDVRIVFKKDIEDKNRHAVIIHNLKFEYLKNRQEEELFISMDTSDLKKLRDAIDRALLKESKIKDDYNGSISFIELND